MIDLNRRAHLPTGRGGAGDLSYRGPVDPHDLERALAQAEYEQGAGFVRERSEAALRARPELLARVLAREEAQRAVRLRHVEHERVLEQERRWKRGESPLTGGAA